MWVRPPLRAPKYYFMAIEIEKKFLVDKVLWNQLSKENGQFIKQGYLSFAYKWAEENLTVRVRIIDNKKAFLTIKGKTTGISRDEFEFEIPMKDAEDMFNTLVKTKIEKIRYKIWYKNKVWDVDEFLDNNDGLILAEIELLSEDEIFEKPNWVGTDVSSLPQYYNSNLAKKSAPVAQPDRATAF